MYHKRGAAWMIALIDLHRNQADASTHHVRLPVFAECTPICTTWSRFLCRYINNPLEWENMARQKRKNRAYVVHLEWTPGGSLLKTLQRLSFVDQSHLIRRLRCSVNSCKDVILRRDVGPKFSAVQSLYMYVYITFSPSAFRERNYALCGNF